jgi:hypothetical protein
VNTKLNMLDGPIGAPSVVALAGAECIVVGGIRPRHDDNAFADQAIASRLSGLSSW